MLASSFKKAYLNIKNKSSKYSKETRTVAKTLKFISDLVLKKLIAFQNKNTDPKAY